MLTVLMVDDDPNLRDATKQILERYGNMTVQVVASAKGALGILNTQTFDAIVLDYAMPEIDGLEFLKIIRLKGDSTPVVFFTAVGGEHAAIEALNSGADYFVKKDEDSLTAFRELIHGVKQAVDRRFIGRSVGASEKVLSDATNFFPEASFAIDREGKVIAWNKGMEDLTGVLPSGIVGKGDHEYAIPFMGRKAPILVDMIFDDEETIQDSGFTIIKKDERLLIGWIRATGADGKEVVWWMKAMPIYDGRGAFIGAMGAVRDITGLIGSELKQPVPRGRGVPAGVVGGPGHSSPPTAQWLVNKLLGKAKSHYKEGLRRYYREGKYAEAIELFDRAIEIDPTFPYVWHDRGVCCRELGRDEEALRCFERALELAPDEEEFWFSHGNILKKIGILKGEKRILGYAIHSFNNVLDINPNNATVWSMVGVCLKEQGKEEESRQYFDRANQLIRENKNKDTPRNIERLI